MYCFSTRQSRRRLFLRANNCTCMATQVLQYYHTLLTRPRCSESVIACIRSNRPHLHPGRSDTKDTVESLFALPEEDSWVEVQIVNPNPYAEPHLACGDQPQVSTILANPRLPATGISKLRWAHGPNPLFPVRTWDKVHNTIATLPSPSFFLPLAVYKHPYPPQVTPKPGANSLPHHTLLIATLFWAF